MREKRRLRFGYKADRSLCGKELRRDREAKSDDTEQSEQYAHVYYVPPVTAVDTSVNHRGNDKRYDKLKRSLEKLEKRSENTLLDVALKEF